MRKRVEEAVMHDIAEMLYEIDTASRERLGRKCGLLRASPEYIYICLMLQDGVRPMEIVQYLRRCDPQNFAEYLVTDDALRMQIERMRKYLGLEKGS